MKNLRKTFNNKKVIVTGHTGFKGSWLTLWLLSFGAKIIGISKEITSYPSHYELLNIKKKIKEQKLDLSNYKALKKTIVKEKPDFIFHLAAQALVKKSFLKSKETFTSNTIGTLNILESVKNLKKKCVIILITSDKVYKNLEIKKGYKENDILGGSDPYSASKAAAEIVISSYIESFFSLNLDNKRIAIARAGNVIGGGDWSADRLIPDCVKAWSKNKTASIRNPNSTRPWQHVLEALYGYLILADKLKKSKELHGQAFNFGPNKKNNFKVISVIKLMKKGWGNIDWVSKKTKNSTHKESKLLKLNSLKAKSLLKWQCILNFEETIELVSSWYKDYYKYKKVGNLSLNQIKFYENKIKKR